MLRPLFPYKEALEWRAGVEGGAPGPPQKLRAHWELLNLFSSRGEARNLHRSRGRRITRKRGILALPPPSAFSPAKPRSPGRTVLLGLACVDCEGSKSSRRSLSHLCVPNHV